MDDTLPTPLISVLMSVYNGRHYLAEAVESILAQGLPDFEFLIIDDGSSDGSTEDLKSYAARDPRIRLWVEENTGLTKALNLGLRLARGEFIARMDADDVARPDRFARQVAAFSANPKLVLLGAKVELISDDGIPLGSRGTTRGHDNIRRRLLIGDGNAMIHPVVMFRRRAALDVGMYDARFPTGQDIDLFLRLSEIGLVDNLPDTLLHWRQHKDSVNRTRSSTWKVTKALAIEKTLARIGTKRYAEELFKTEREFYFPQGQFDLGRFALVNGRYKEAGQLFWRELKHGARRWAAFEQLSLVVISGLYRRVRRLLSPTELRK